MIEPNVLKAKILVYLYHRRNRGYVDLRRLFRRYDLDNVVVHAAIGMLENHDKKELITYRKDLGYIPRYEISHAQRINPDGSKAHVPHWSEIEFPYMLTESGKTHVVATYPLAVQLSPRNVLWVLVLTIVGAILAGLFTPLGDLVTSPKPVDKTESVPDVTGNEAKQRGEQRQLENAKIKPRRDSINANDD